MLRRSSDVADFEVFRDALRDALYHLHDQDFVPPDPLCEALGCWPDVGPGPIQTRIIAEIEWLKPDEQTPPDSRAWSHFRSLDLRFINGLSQEDTAELLHMSVRNVQRVQSEAIQVLAQRIWRELPGTSAARDTAQAPDWRSQTQREIASLRVDAPNAQTDVAHLIQSVVDLETRLAAGRGVGVSVGFVERGLVAAAHPTILRQTLITAIGFLAPRVSSPEIMLYATLDGGKTRLTLTGTLKAGADLDDREVAASIILPPEASTRVHQRSGDFFLEFSLPAVGEQTILVIEDNPDMVYFYRRCTAGTRYHIVQGPAVASEIMDAVERMRPDAIILDVMLPAADGWQLLTHLRERLTTRDIPVIVCSVVKEEDLALALGAAAFLSKPIYPRDLVAALDQVLTRASSSAEIAPTNSAGVV